MWAGFEPESASDQDLLDVLNIKYDDTADIHLPKWTKTNLGTWAAQKLCHNRGDT